MRKDLSGAIAAILLAGVGIQPAWSRSGPVFQPPGIASAGNIAYPIDVMTPGIVTLIANLDSPGNVQNLDVLRDVPSLTSVASAAVKSWTFTPATLDGQPVASVIPISVVFNPFNPTGASNLSPTISLSAATPVAVSGYVPPQITAASYATYPVNSVAGGAVVLEVQIAKTGSIEKVRVVHGVPALTLPATKTVKSWTFSAATYQGTPIASRTVVAFVFPQPGTGNF